jgi:CRP-like cAMP-binding protein
MTVAITPSRLREISLFKDLADEALAELARHCRIQELHAGETLFRQGDPGDAFYLLEDGQIHIVREYPTGEEVVLATYGPYYVIGELSMIVGQPRTGSVVAVSDCELIALERDALIQVCEKMPEVATKVMHDLGLRLYAMNLQVREHAIGNVQARVASLLLLLCGYQEGTFPHPLRVTRMARTVGMDADLLDRLLQKWVSLGYLSYDGRTLTVRNVDALRDIAG